MIQRNILSKRTNNYIAGKIIVLLLLICLLSASHTQAAVKSKEYSNMTKNWNTYDNEELGVSVKYAPDWEVRSLGPMSFFIISKKQSPYIMIGLFMKNLDDPSQSLRKIVDETINPKDTFKKPKFRESDIDGASALMVSGQSLKQEGIHVSYFFVKKDGSFITLNITGVPSKQWKEYEKYFEAMAYSLELK